MLVRWGIDSSDSYIANYLCYKRFEATGEEYVPPTYLLGDANIDGVVSAGDYSSVQANFGSTGPAGGGLMGDANHDGVVSAGDYASVQAKFWEYSSNRNGS